MIVGIGCDVVDHALTKQLNWEEDPVLLKNVFSSEELKLYNVEPRTSFLTGRYAGKEAVMKCFGSGMQDGIRLADIQILQTPDGGPIVKLKGEAKKISDTLSINNWHISISHSSSASMAFAVAEKWEN